MVVVKKLDILAFARRDWAAVAESKAAYWASREKAAGAGAGIEAGDQPRRQILMSHPGWPAEEDRQVDIETHVRVAACLRRVVASRRR
jgi:hypothetical protein